MRLNKYTEQQLRDAIATSKSFREVLIKLKVKPAGGNYLTLHKAIEYYKLSTNHMTGARWNKGRKFGPKREITAYLNNDYRISSDRLRRRLLNEGIFKPVCSNCGLELWLNQPIPLELDHINGNHLDNTLSNLRLLCPNCHALTLNYRGKNKGSY